MINKKGKFYTATLASLGLSGLEADVATVNASSIIINVVAAYEDEIGKGHVGDKGAGVPKGFRRTKQGPTGLVYGRIQSGKTRAMITTTAMAFDNGFRIVVVMTSNINDLVNQTHGDFSRVLQRVLVLTKDDELSEEIDNADLDLSSVDGRILIITSKGNTSLNNVIDFLSAIEAKKFPLLIFDDEGDQASLDTNTYKRSKTGDLTLEKSPINKLIFRIRTEFPASVYVSVTGTPQGVLLQTASSDNKPSFIDMLPPGQGYIGGDSFFSTPEPEDNSGHLISIVPNEDKSRILNPASAFPDGLRDAIVFFLLSASAAQVNLNWPANGKGFQFLCHPSLKNNEQGRARSRISWYLTEIRKILLGQPDTLGIIPSFRAQHRILQTQLGIANTPSLPVLQKIIDQEIRGIEILVINFSNSKRKGIEYGPSFNFLIGGNTLGRGIAIPNLLVTYYVRQSVTSQMDTMHQHARMFGYREATLKYTKLFTTRTLYYRFRDIYSSDQSSRYFIEDHINDDPNTFPIDTSVGLRPTRNNVLDIETVETVGPGMQIYPNRMRLPQTARSINSIWRSLYTLFKVKNEDLAKLKAIGPKGVLISIDQACAFLDEIKTRSQKNSWHDSSIQMVLTKLAESLGSKVRLKYRPARRTILPDGLISSGTLGGPEQDEARADNYTTLWIMDVTPYVTPGSPVVAPFMFPTIVVPRRLPRFFVFSKK
jgi:hypothetical protein